MKALIVAGFLLLSVGSIATVLFYRRFADVRWPLLAYLAAWTGSAGLAAAYVLIPGGIDDWRSFLGWVSPEVVPFIGSPTYAALLLLPYILVPAATLVGAKATNAIVAPIEGVIRSIATHRGALICMLGIAATYCLFKLYQTGHLVPDVLLSGAGYEEKIKARATIMSDLRFTFYAMFYAVIPSIAVLFWARYLDRPRAVDLALAAATYVLFIYLATVTYLKAPALYIILMLATVAVVAELGWMRRLLYLAGLLAFGAGTFVSLQVFMGGTGTVEVQKPVVVQQLNAPKRPPMTSTPAPRPNPPAPTTTVRVEDAPLVAQYQLALRSTASSLLFRMGSSFPYYVAVFDNPANRCGIETNGLPLLPAPSCVIPTKIHAAMYPKVTFVTGFTPAAAHVSAFGEIGLGHAVIILMLSGLSIGALCSVAGKAEGSIRMGLLAVGVIYAYFLTQVPFIGALTYGHGLVFYLVPFVALFGMGLATAARQGQIA